jgi:adenylate cyclase class 2
VIKLIEVEVKVSISDPDLYRKKFVEHNGTYQSSFIHEDTYYNMPEGLRDFKSTDEALRIRKSLEYHKNKKEPRQKPNYFITYKGAKLDTSTKTRRELETPIDDGEVLKKILNILGFREILTVKKERDLYEFFYRQKKMEVLIDYIPILDQSFIEAEILAEKEEQIKEHREILFGFLSEFGIDKKNSIRRSYLELIVIELIKRGEFTL